VLGHRPCIPYGTYCSVFNRQPCIPDIDYPIGQTLQLTILSRAEAGTSDTRAEEKPVDASPNDLNSIRGVFSALRGCWIPPEKDAARAGMEITLRFSFNSRGAMISETKDDLCLGRYAAGRSRDLLECGNGCAQTMYAAAIRGQAWWGTGRAVRSRSGSSKIARFELASLQAIKTRRPSSASADQIRDGGERQNSTSART
jgi:hypothetical protein